MTNFIIFVAPFLVLFGAIGLTFFVAPKDEVIRKRFREEGE